MPSISVVIPCRNQGVLLKEAIASLVGGDMCLGRTSGQTVTDFEVIVVDDDSNDDTAQVAQSLAATDDRLTVIKTDLNVGTAGALNIGIGFARAEYIYILAADDLLETWALERMLAAAQVNPEHVCYGDLMVVTGGQRVKEWRLTGYDFEKVVHKNPMPAAGVIYPRQAWKDVGGYAPVMRWGREGWAFNVACGLHGWCGLHIGAQSGYLYRRDGQGRSQRTGGRHPQIEPPQGYRTWQAFYAAQMRTLFPQVYVTKEYPMGCCGKPVTKAKGGNTPAPPAPTVSDRAPAGREGFAVVEYIGRSKLDQTFWVSNTRYKFGGVHKYAYVAQEHLAAVLKMRGRRGQPVIREVAAKVAKPKPAPKPKPKPKPSAPPPPPPPEPEPQSEPEPASSPPAPEPESRPVPMVEKTVVLQPEPAPEPESLKDVEDVEATESAVNLARAVGIPLYEIEGTGAGGRIIKKDVQREIKARQEAA